MPPELGQQLVDQLIEANTRPEDRADVYGRLGAGIEAVLRDGRISLDRGAIAGIGVGAGGNILLDLPYALHLLHPNGTDVEYDLRGVAAIGPRRLPTRPLPSGQQPNRKDGGGSSSNAMAISIFSGYGSYLLQDDEELKFYEAMKQTEQRYQFYWYGLVVR